MKKWFKNKCYPDRPKFATLKEWDEIDKKEQEKPFCYFCVHTLPSWWQGVKYKIKAPWLWLQYRVNPAHRYHLINTGLTPGYYDIDTRMLHGMFNMLKEFVEVELPRYHWICKSKDTRPKTFASGREAGLNSLSWQKELTYDEDECKALGKEELIGKPLPQAEMAMEIEALYLWWVDDRPARIDPWDEKINDSWSTEKLYANEDTEMLIRLIKIRKELWT